MLNKKILISTILLVTAIAAVAGCTGSSSTSDNAQGTPTATPSITAQSAPSGNSTHPMGGRGNFTGPPDGNFTGRHGNGSYNGTFPGGYPHNGTMMNGTWPQNGTWPGRNTTNHTWPGGATPSDMPPMPSDMPQAMPQDTTN